MITLNICLSDIPKEKISKAKNGKSYVNLIVDKRKEKDQYDNTHYIAVSRTKQERDNKVQTIYVGSGKEYNFDYDSSTPNNENEPNEEDELPF